jgi:hypothetical protein
MPRPATAMTVTTAATAGTVTTVVVVPTVPGYARSTASFRAFIFSRMREDNLLPPLDMDTNSDTSDTSDSEAKAKSLFESTADDWFWGDCGDTDIEVNSESSIDDIRHIHPLPPVCRGMRRVVLVNPFVNVGFFSRRRPKTDGLCSREPWGGVKLDLVKN